MMRPSRPTPTRTQATASLALSLLLAASLALAFSAALPAADTALPFNMKTNHLNLVVVATDGDAVETFYGDILGLEQLETWTMSSSGAQMIRFLAGTSELKFIVHTKEKTKPLRRYNGGLSDARGIRLVALLLPMSERAGIEERYRKHGLDPVAYSEQPYYTYGLATDPDGNTVEIVFLDDEKVPAETFKQAQIGLVVSNANAMNAFLSDVLGLEKTGAQESPGSGLTVHKYGLGDSEIKFWETDAGKPAHVGSPYEMVGLSLVQFIVPDVDAVRAAVLERGGSIHTEPYRLGKGSTIMFVDGPDGILFEFAGPLLARLAD